MPLRVGCWQGGLADVIRSIPIVGVLNDPTSIATWDSNLVLMSLITGALAVWDPESKENVLVTEFTLPIDAHPFRGDLLVTELAAGQVVRASGPVLAERQVILNQTGVRFLDGNDDNVFASVSNDEGMGSVIQIIAEGQVLDPPVTVSSGHMDPEGIALHGKEVVVVTNAGPSGALEIVDLESGQVRTVATNLGFLSAVPGVLPFGWLNDVVVSPNGTIYVNSDQANAIYKFENEFESPKEATTEQNDMGTSLASELNSIMAGLVMMNAGASLLFC